MRKVALALALLFCAGVALDSFDASCVQTESCQACLCRTSALVPMSSSDEIVDAPKQVFTALKFDLFADRLIDKTLFRPPIIPA